MFLRRFISTLMLAWIACSAPATAREEIAFVDGETWKHPHGSIAAPPNLVGLPRFGGIEFADDSLDIGIVYRAGGHEGTLYVYRKTNGSAPIWFAQANDAIIARDLYDDPKLVGEIEPVGVGESGVPLGLKAVYEPGPNSSMASTGLAVIEVNGWYVKLRFSSQSLTTDQASEWIDEALKDLVVGDVAAPKAMIAPIGDCPVELNYKNRTRDVKADGAAQLLGGLLGAMAIDGSISELEETDEDSSPVTWCRDSFIEPGQASYRNIESENAYLLALGDNGSAISVAPDGAAALLAAADGKNSELSYSVTLIREAKNLSFAPQNRFPSPKRVLKMLEKGEVVSSISTWGDENTVEINSDSL